MILAHGIGGRSDLPVPLWLAAYAGACAVLISFFALAAFWMTPKLKGREGGRPFPEGVRRVVDARATRVVLRAFGLLIGAVFLAVAWFGPNDSARNPAPTWFYVWLWVGLVPLSVLFGPVWRLVNPLRTLAQGLSWVLARVGVRGREYPQRWGYWPAVVSLLGFLWLELVYGYSDPPRTVAAFVTGYAVVHTMAGAFFGQRWFEYADGFEVYSNLLAYLAPVGRRSDGRLVVRNPLDGLASLVPAPGLVAVVCVLLGSTTFDGVTRSQVWTDLTSSVGNRAVYLLLGTAGLCSAIAFIALTYLGAIRLSRHYFRVASRDVPGRLEGAFIHSLIPIAVGYTVAHYFSFALFQGQAGYLLASDPLRKGWNLFGTAGSAIDYGLVAASVIAAVQIGAIVLGHVVGVASAHDRAVAMLPRRNKKRGQYPLLALMVTYTTVGIVLVAGV